MTDTLTVLADADLRRLRWRARRGLLENDIILDRFLTREGGSLDRRAAVALESLLALGDNELLAGPLGPHFWRAPVDNDRGNKDFTVGGVSVHSTVNGKLISARMPLFFIAWPGTKRHSR